MKQININILLFSVFLFGLVSCLKTGDMNIDTDKGPANVVEFANTGDNVAGTSSTYPRFTSDLGTIASGKSVSFNVNLSYAGGNVAPQDITINLGVNPALLTTYNSQNGTDYVAPPAAIYNLPATAIIKKGTRDVQIKVEITNNSNFDFNVNYALPLEIVSATAGVISSNFGKAVYSFSARNQFDGIYEMNATAPLVDVLAPSITGWYPIEMQLITFTGNSIALYDGINYVDAYGHPIRSGASGSYYGAFSPVFYFDATGKITSVGNYYGQNAGGNKRSAELNPSGVNQATFNADGSIKSFEVSYIMTQSVSTPNAPRTYFYEKFTYVGPR